MEFLKMHGLGNDFVVIDEIKNQNLVNKNLSDLAKKICDRRFGIGADGLVLLLPSEKADFKMRIINSDGSEAEMCGNAIRCVARYYVEKYNPAKKQLEVETLAGIIKPEVLENNMVRVDMGRPILKPQEIPVAVEEEPVNIPLEVLGQKFYFTAVSMGNPHAVIFVDSLAKIELEKYGPLIETHPLFPRKTNVEFVEILSPAKVKVFVWERGAGATLACGTGASAVVVAGRILGHLQEDVEVVLPGGSLFINWVFGESVYMTGPAEIVFKGEYFL
ncbi:diaminopimelate epimerase [Carboxydothermus ferrireducens]|nr:diaminopimelate epimerase [Carboxydothermus ferrireducens]